MKLIPSNVTFEPVGHTYTLDGKRLEGITDMLKRQLFPGMYEGVPDEVLNAAKERGSMVHEICELIDTLGIENECQEAKNYIALRDKNGLVHEASEYIVTDREHFASPIDKVYRTGECSFILADIKTSSVLYREYTRWQLSIYAYLFEMQNPGAIVDGLYAIWLRGDNAEWAELERVPAKDIEDLLRCEVEGRQYINPYPVKVTLPVRYAEGQIIELYEAYSYYKEKMEQLKEGIMQEMVKAGVYNYTGQNLQFIRKRETIRKSFDREAFEKDHPGVYEKYIKESPVTGSITLKIG